MARWSKVRIFADEAERLQRIVRDTPVAVQRASSTLARDILPFTRRDIQNEYNLGSRRIMQDLFVRTGAGFVELIGRRRRIGLLQYGARQTATGIAVRVFARGTRELYKGAFIATGLSGNRHAFVRRGSKRVMQMGRYRGKRRQPIDVLYEGSIAEYLSDLARQDRLSQFAREKFRAELERITGRKL